MTAKSSAVLKSQFQGADPDNHNTDLIDSMDGAITTTATAAELDKLSGSGAVVPSGTAQTNIADLTIVYTTNDPSITPDGSITFADGSAATVVELLEAMEELSAKQNLILDALLAFGIMSA